MLARVSVCAGSTYVNRRSCIPTLLLNSRIPSGYKRAHGQMYDSWRRGFRRGVRGELELCARGHSCSTRHPQRIHIRKSVSSSWRILPRWRMRKYDGAGGRSSCQSGAMTNKNRGSTSANLATKSAFSPHKKVMRWKRSKHGMGNSTANRSGERGR